MTWAKIEAGPTSNRSGGCSLTGFGPVEGEAGQAALGLASPWPTGAMGQTMRVRAVDGALGRAARLESVNTAGELHSARS